MALKIVRESKSGNMTTNPDFELGTIPDVVRDTGKRELVSAAAEEDTKIYPPARKAAIVMLALYLSLFLVSLDRTIISTALPQITDVFHSIDDIEWYGSAYMMTGCAFQLAYGRVYTFFDPKWVFLSSVFVFEIGSLVCGCAASSPMFIVGRAAAGLGSAGIFGGSVVLVVDVVPLRRRPVYQSFMGMVFLISSVVGPLIGGALTSGVSWRWCFWINLPVGGVTLLLTVFFMRGQPEETEMEKLAWGAKLGMLDPIGTLCFLPGIVCLLLALQWGGSTYSWGDGRMIALWILFGVLMVAFAGVQVWKGENATLPPRILAYRSVTSSAFFAFCINGSLMVLVYYLPLWFQAIQGVSALESGIRLLPTIIALVVASIIAGGMVSAVGYYTPFLILCSVMMAVGAGLMMRFEVDSKRAVWIGYQVVFGLGLGFGQQQAGLAAQVVLPAKDVPTGVSLKFFGQQLGGAVFVAVGQSVLSNGLVDGLKGFEGLDPQVIVNLGATELRNYVGEEWLGEVLKVYNEALVGVWRIGLVLACVAMVGAVGTEWKSVRGRDMKGA